MARSNAKHLVIVESPAKAKTINKYLGDAYIVKASMGHVRDLPLKGMGVDLKSFEPEYVVIDKAAKVISELRKLARQSDEVYLATDPDREGEAIAWHLKESLKIPDAKAHRVMFNAITKTEIEKAFKTPHHIDINRVNAQQARRILDRIVGYEISPLLWRKVAKGLSAGRVQSVAVRLVADREREIAAFVPTEFWRIGAIFTAQTQADLHRQLIDQWRQFSAPGQEESPTRGDRERWLGDHDAFAAELVEFAGRKFGSARAKAPTGAEDSEAEALEAAGDSADSIGLDHVKRIAASLGLRLVKEEKQEDPAGKGPARNRVTLITALGGETSRGSEARDLAAASPRFTVRSVERKRGTSRPSAPFITSTLQQAASTRLSLGAKRAMGLAQHLYEAGHITYMRTDSTHLSADAVTMARGYIQKEFGDRYLPAKPPAYSSSNKSAQEAHEAIRPTDVSLTPQAARAKLPPDEWRLYQLIWNRFVASQMTPAEFDQTAVIIGADTPDGTALFRATGRKLVFDGFMRVTGVSSDDQLLPALEPRQPVLPIDISPTQHFTQPPPRFTEASLVKELERLGIGRPSTYASIIHTIQDRKYVQQIDRRFHATLLGQVVTEKLMQTFPDIMNVKFTADMETKLDQIEEQHLDWVKLLREFYGPFHQDVEGALGKIEHAGGAPSPHPCSKCGGPTVYRISKTSFFLACTDREQCGATQPVDHQGNPQLREVSEFKCPVCGRDMIKRRGRFGEFLGCSGYSEKDEQGNPMCATIINLDPQGRPLPPKPKPIQTDIPCAKCSSPMLLRDSKRGPFLGCSAFPKCRSTRMVKKLDEEQQQRIEALLPQLQTSAEEARQLVARLGGPAAAAASPPQRIVTSESCSQCGEPMIVRQSRRGPFLGCSAYPKCRNSAEISAQLLEDLGLAGDAKKKPTGDAAADGEIQTDLLLDGDENGHG